MALSVSVRNKRGLFQITNYNNNNMTQNEKMEIAEMVLEKIKAYLSPRHDDYISVNDMAVLMHWSKSTVYQHLYEIPHTKMGKKCLILRSNAEEYKRNYYNLD